MKGKTTANMCLTLPFLFIFKGIVDCFAIGLRGTNG